MQIGRNFNLSLLCPTRIQKLNKIMHFFGSQKHHHKQIYYDTARLRGPTTLGLVNISNRTTKNRQHSYGVNIKE
jgi:hypothetical protein